MVKIETGLPEELRDELEELSPEAQGSWQQPTQELMGRVARKAKYLAPNRWEVSHGKSERGHVASPKYLKFRRIREKVQREIVCRVNRELAKTRRDPGGFPAYTQMKIVPRRDASGTIDVYFGGKNIDGIGHGHAVLNSRKEIVYLRDASFGEEEEF